MAEALSAEIRLRYDNPRIDAPVTALRTMLALARAEKP